MAKSVSKTRRAFTLLELLVVIAIIVLVIGSVLPSVLKIFSSGADAQAYNMLAAQLMAARGLAITEGTYAGVHVQMDNRAGAVGDCYLAVVIYKDVDDRENIADMKFVLAEGFTPRRAPGGFAFGELRGPNLYGLTEFVNASSQYDNLTTGNNVDDFLTFTIVFSPSGGIVKGVLVQPIAFDDGAKYGSTFNPGAGKAFLWNLPPDEPGASAVTMFSYNEFRDAGADRPGYLRLKGRFIPINVYTGQLFDRE